MKSITHADPLIAQVLETWLPRFLNGGIAYGDLATTVGRMRSWDDWGPEWLRTAATHEALAEEAWAAGRRISAVEAFQTAAIVYHVAYFIYLRDMDIHAQGLRKMLECHDRVLPYMEPAVEKFDIPFGGSRLPALFSRPRGAGKSPVVILLPGLDSTKEGRHRARGSYLRRGIAVLSLDGPGQGEASQWLTIRPDYEHVIAAAIDHLETRDDLDARRVGLYGMSLGGYYAPRAAAHEPRVSACAGNCGPYDWSACFASLPQVTRDAFQHYSGARSMNEATERARQLTLEGSAAQINCPLLIVHGKQDPLIPWEQGQRIVDEARSRQKRFVLFDQGSHGISNLPYQVNPLVADWMAEQLGGVVA
jgi:dipeptidyl aminopeptidase/acylaminoacyl peptidase